MQQKRVHSQYLDACPASLLFQRRVEYNALEFGGRRGAYHLAGEVGGKGGRRERERGVGTHRMRGGGPSKTYRNIFSLGRKGKKTTSGARKHCGTKNVEAFSRITYHTRVRKITNVDDCRLPLKETNLGLLEPTY